MRLFKLFKRNKPCQINTISDLYLITHGKTGIPMLRIIMSDEPFTMWMN